MTAPARVECGDALDVLRGMGDGSVQCVITSPPYYGLRSYIPPGSMRLRADLTPEQMAYVVGELRKAGVIPNTRG